jgi:hypothetical protein
MAKFTSKDLRLKDGQKVTWGTDLDSNIWWDDAAVELRLDTVISGVTPTEDGHLTTKWYVDNEVATLSGSIVLDHGGLTGLDDDDHTQYVPTDGSRGFTSTVSGIDPIQDYHLATKSYLDDALATVSGGIVAIHGNLLLLGADDHTQYSLADGSRAFTSTVGGVTPTAGTDLTTKAYVDTEVSGVEAQIITDHGSLTGTGDDDHTQYSLADGSRAFTGTVGGITPSADSDLTTKFYVDSAVQGLTWLEPVINIVPVASGIASEGNRYLASETGGGWTEDYIYEYIGATWSGTAPVDGSAVWVEDLDYLTVYNGTDWVKFGSTVQHNNTSNIQGGTTDEYYHLTSDQYSSLTDSGGVEDASDMHTHDDRYYTETEIDVSLAAIDATISGVESQIITDHGGLTGLGDDDHTQYSLVDGSRAFTSTVGGVTPSADTDLTTKLYVDTAVSGVETQIITDHGDLAGLGDDDHTQYILVDGSRGFTSTVSGVAPVADSDLATKYYVDHADQPQLHGRQAIADQASTVVVSFTALPNTDYTVNATLENTSDSPPSIYPFIVSAKTTSSFTVTFAGDMDSANYLLDWMIIED